MIAGHGVMVEPSRTNRGEGWDLASRRIRPLLIGVPLVFLAWIASAVAASFLQPPGRPVEVVSSSGVNGALAAVIAADGDIVQVRGDAVIAISDDAGFVARLYRAGALLVLPGMAGGCGFTLPAGPGAPLKSGLGRVAPPPLWGRALSLGEAEGEPRERGRGVLAAWRHPSPGFPMPICEGQIGEIRPPPQGGRWSYGAVPR